MANVLHKTTFQYLESVNTIDYMNNSDWLINPDLSSVATVPKKYWKVDGESVVEMNQAEKDAVDLTNLPAVKEAKLQEIDTRSGELISQGITFDGHVFSLSTEAQLNWNSLYTAMQGGLIPADAPYEISTKDPENDKYILMPENRNAFFGLVLSTVGTILAEGRAIRDQVKAATTITEVNAIVDPR